MAYTAWSVVYGEQPTAAKWNQLGQNDAGFKDGSNIDPLAIAFSKIDISTFPLCKAIDSASQSITNTTGTVADLNLTSFEHNRGGFSLASNEVTIPTAGLYLLMGEVRLVDTENHFDTITINNSVVAQLAFAGRTSTSRGYQVSTGFSLRTCAAGDKIKLRYENRALATTAYFKALTILRVG